MPEDDAAPLQPKHYLGWVLLLLVLIPLITYSLVLHIRENRALTKNNVLWQQNWSQLKLGLSKEEVLALVGAPNSTVDLEARITDLTTEPKDEAIEKDVREKIDQVANCAIWSYYEPIIIHTRQGEDLKTAEGESAIQFKQLVNNGSDDKLHGHAIKFNAAGQIIEISPPSPIP